MMTSVNGGTRWHLLGTTSIARSDYSSHTLHLPTGRVEGAIRVPSSVNADATTVCAVPHVVLRGSPPVVEEITVDESKGLQDKLIWLFLLSPGFISVTITGMIVDLGQLSEFQITFYSLVLTVVSLAFSVALLWLYGKLIFWRKDTWRWGAPAFLTVTLLLSVALGLGLGIAAERDTFFVKLRALPITDSLNKRSSSRPVTFLLSQNTRGRLSTEGDARP